MSHQWTPTAPFESHQNEQRVHEAPCRFSSLSRHCELPARGYELKKKRRTVIQVAALNLAFFNYCTNSAMQGAHREIWFLLTRLWLLLLLALLMLLMFLLPQQQALTTLTLLAGLVFSHLPRPDTTVAMLACHLLGLAFGQ